MRGSQDAAAGSHQHCINDCDASSNLVDRRPPFVQPANPIPKSGNFTSPLTRRRHRCAGWIRGVSLVQHPHAPQFRPRLCCCSSEGARHPIDAASARGTPARAQGSSTSGARRRASVCLVHDPSCARLRGACSDAGDRRTRGLSSSVPSTRSCARKRGHTGGAKNLPMLEHR
jgi:hypothetical protein